MALGGLFERSLNLGVRPRNAALAVRRGCRATAASESR
jgi:hypothetical protein